MYIKLFYFCLCVIFVYFEKKERIGSKIFVYFNICVLICLYGFYFLDLILWMVDIKI